MSFKAYLLEGAMTSQEFVNGMVDVADSMKIDYNNMKTKDIIKSLIGGIRSDKKYKKLYTYWSKNRSAELEAELTKAFN